MCIMSIKSQKSLNDECSEIFEKSYSVKSGSEDSLSCDEEDSLPYELLRLLTPAVLSKLRKHFRRSKSKTDVSIDKRIEEAMRSAAAEEGIEFPQGPQHVDDLYIDHKGFVDALHNIFGSAKYSQHAAKLLLALDPLGSGRVGWTQLLSRLAHAGARVPVARAERWVPVQEPRIINLLHCKRETCVRVVSIERDDSFCYAMVSRGGRVGVYGGDLKLLNSYQIFYHRTGVERRVKNCWITDAVYMSDVQCVTFSASDRSVTVYDAATLTHAPLYCVTGLPNIPTCLAYCPAGDGVDCSDLLFGSEHGEVTRLRFLRPRVALLPVRSSDHISSYFWMELSSPEVALYCSASTWRAHARSVRRLACERDGVVVSCSQDARCSLRLRPRRGGLLPDYVYAVPRGITCFHVVTPLQLLATGSPDGVVRLWGTTGGAAHARLVAPAAVLDVAIVAAAEIVLAFCGNISVLIWDVYEECLLQTIKIRFPFLGVLGKKPEFGVYCLHPGPPRETSDTDSSESEKENVQSETEFDRGGRGEVLVTSCDALGVLVLHAPARSVRAAPSDTLRARRPSDWELPGDCLAVQPLQPSHKPLPPTPPTVPEPPASESEEPVPDLNDLLEKAGLQNLLEKDFILMKGLKHELNSKLHELAGNMAAMRSFVSLGAPYLALRSCELEPLPTFERLLAASDRIMSEFDRGGRGEVLVTSCDALGMLVLHAPARPVRAAPSDTLRARRPSDWELPGDCLAGECRALRHAARQETFRLAAGRGLPRRATTSAASQAAPTHSPSVPEPPASESEPVPDLNDLLEKAGLQNLLEKDFILMKGLKHELNSKLHELAGNMAAMRSFVSLGAPYLALRSCELEPLPTFERLLAASDRIMRSYPERTAATPTGSERSTPSTPRSTPYRINIGKNN